MSSKIRIVEKFKSKFLIIYLLEPRGSVAARTCSTITWAWVRTRASNIQKDAPIQEHLNYPLTQLTFNGPDSGPG